MITENAYDALAAEAERLRNEVERLRGLVVEACVKGFCQALPYTPSEATMRLVREWAVITRHRLELGPSTEIPMVFIDHLPPVLDELARAKTKFPDWPTDPFHALAIIGEEFGELQQTFLKSTYEGGKAPEKAEAVQLAAMALRFLQHWDDYCPHHESLEERAPKWIRHEGGAMPEGVDRLAGIMLLVSYDDDEVCPYWGAGLVNWAKPLWYMVIPAPPAPPKGGEG